MRWIFLSKNALPIWGGSAPNTVRPHLRWVGSSIINSLKIIRMTYCSNFHDFNDDKVLGKNLRYFIQIKKLKIWNLDLWHKWFLFSSKLLPQFFHIFPFKAEKWRNHWKNWPNDVIRVFICCEKHEKRLHWVIEPAKVS